MGSRQYWSFDPQPLSVIASFFLRLNAQMMIHLSAQHPLRQAFLQLVD
jgi:hypothetical protein